MPLIQWTYLRDATGVFYEYGVCTAREAPSLRAHFHSQAQLSAVLGGYRSFRLDSEVFKIGAGECLYIPPGRLHQSLSSRHDQTHFLNAYLEGPVFGSQAIVMSVDRIPGLMTLGQSLLPPKERAACDHSSDDGSIQFQPRGIQTGPVVEVAARLGVSREHFSRRFRNKFGVGPHTYWLLQRLDEGRARLRAGQEIAAVAADMDFVDQSHFGRLFKEAYGVTPGRYVLGMR